jgi:hypothetical protein
LLLDTGCLGYEQKYELFTRNEIRAGAKYFQDSTLLVLCLKTLNPQKLKLDYKSGE